MFKNICRGEELWQAPHCCIFCSGEGFQFVVFVIRVNPFSMSILLLHYQFDSRGTDSAGIR
jgi:hypothetical protein